jgi:hypothetical protein
LSLAPTGGIRAARTERPTSRRAGIRREGQAECRLAAKEETSLVNAGKRRTLKVADEEPRRKRRKPVKTPAPTGRSGARRGAGRDRSSHNALVASSPR